MAKTKPRVIMLKGADTAHYSEDGAAGAAITPGMLVSGVTTLVPWASAGAAGAYKYADFRDEMGKTIDDAYAIGDTVKVVAVSPSDRINALIASGENIASDALLEAAADGTLRVLASGVAVARALEAVNNSAGPSWARLRVEAV
jgi:hypothetical protein